MRANANLSDHRHNTTDGGDRVVWLNADRGRVLGPIRTQEVQKGQTLNLNVQAKFEDQKKSAKLPVLASTFTNKENLIQGLTEFGTKVSPGVNQLAILNILGLVLSDLGEKEVPEAYMAYSLYNSDSVEVARGKHPLSEASKNKHEFLSDTLKVEEDGYIEVYLVNETSENVWPVCRQVDLMTLPSKALHQLSYRNPITFLLVANSQA